MNRSDDGNPRGKWARGVAELRQRRGNYAVLGNTYKPSAAAFWKVENAGSKSPAVINVLIQEGVVETAKRCKANGWLRRAVWVHEDDIAYFESALRRRGTRKFQAMIDDFIEMEREGE